MGRTANPDHYAPVGKFLFDALAKIGKAPSDLYQNEVMSSSGVSNLFRGKVVPKDETIEAIAKFAKVSADAIKSLLQKPEESTKEPKKPRKQPPPPVVIGNAVEERDAQITMMLGKMPKAKSGNTIVLENRQWVKVPCPMCKGDGSHWVPVGEA